MRAILLVTSILFGLAAAARAQTTTFTYQGSLAQDNLPASGVHDFEFRLFTAAVGGSQVGSVVARADVEVTNGLFTVPLDFGASFPGADRFLQISIRPGASTGAYTTLSPRQPITASPYAIKAAEAQGMANGAISSAMLADGSVTASKLAAGAINQLGSPDGSPSTALQVNTNGLVGIGTTTPTAGLHITTGGSFLAPRILFQVQENFGGFTNLFDPSDIVSFGNLLAITASGDGAVTIVDASEPTNAVVRSTVSNGVNGFNGLYRAQGLAASGNLLAIAASYDFEPDYGAVTLVDVSDPANPELLVELFDGTGGFNDLEGARHIVLLGNLLAVAASAYSEISGVYTSGAVNLIDVSDPANPVLRAVLRDGMFGFNELLGASRVTFAGDSLLAIAAAGDDAVTLVDVTEPSNPALRAVLKNGAGGYDSLDGARGLAVSGTLLAIAASNFDEDLGNSSGAVTLVDVSNAANPVLRAVIRDGVGGYDFLAGARGLAFSNSLLAISADWPYSLSGTDQAVTLVDVANPTQPSLRGVFRSFESGINVGALRGLTFSGSTLAVIGQGVSTYYGVGGMALIEPASSIVSLAANDWVGIGTTTPTAPFHVVGNVVVDASRVDLRAGRVAIGTDTIASGRNSTAMGRGSIASGFVSMATGDHTVADGYASTAMGDYTVASGDSSTAMGWNTTASGSISTAMGVSTTASEWASTAMGDSTTASGQWSMAMGRASIASGNGSTAMGDETIASGESSTAMGRLTSATGFASTSLGYSTIASGFGSTAIGYSSSATNAFTVAAGRRAIANHQGAFVWADSTDTDIVSASNNSVTMRAAGGYRLFSNGAASIGVTLGAGANSWASISDRNRKKNIQPLDGRQVLEKLAELPLSTWHYDFESDDETPHIGPMAQDFKAAFYPGRDDTTITTMEFDGVALAAIQGLNHKLEEQLEQKKTEIAELRRELAELRELFKRRPTAAPAANADANPER